MKSEGREIIFKRDSSDMIGYSDAVVSPCSLDRKDQLI